jgi:hypothetical protein
MDDIVPRWALSVPQWKKPKSKKNYKYSVPPSLMYTNSESQHSSQLESKKQHSKGAREYELSREGLPPTIGVPSLARLRLIFNVIF